jgi:arsenate reductase (thioredoxin)
LITRFAGGEQKGKEAMRLRQIAKTRKAVVCVTAALTVSLVGVGKVDAQSEVGANTIVFVCEHGSAKSVVAAAHFNRLAEQNHLPFRAVARGLRPDDAVPTAVRAGLLSDGLNPAEWTPQAITKPEIQRAARVITLGIELPQRATGDKPVQWTDIPSVNEKYASARAAILAHLQELITSLSAGRKR